MTPQCRQIPVHHAVLHAESIGAGRPVIVLHGGPGYGYGYLFKEFRDTLSDSQQVIFYDQRAGGKSTGDESTELLTFSTFLDDLARIYEAFKIPRAILAGHSFGGLLAMHFALRHPELVEGLILVDTDPASRALWIRYTERVLPTPEAAAELRNLTCTNLWEHDPDKVARFYELTLQSFFASPKGMPPGFGRHFAHTPMAKITRTAVPVRKSLGDWDIHADLARLEIPVLIVAGAESIFPKEAPLRLKQSLRHATLVEIPGASHFPLIESPDVFREAVRSFLNSLPL